MTKTSHEFYRTAIQLRDRIISGQSNELPVQARAAVARECAKANNAFGIEQGSRAHGRSQQAFLSNLDKIWWAAKAQVETLGREA